MSLTDFDKKWGLSGSTKKLPSGLIKPDEEEEDLAWAPSPQNLTERAQGLEQVDPRTAAKAREAAKATPSTFLGNVQGALGLGQQLVLRGMTGRHDEHLTPGGLVEEAIPDAPRALKTALGFAGEIGTEPLMLVSGGTGALGRGATKAAGAALISRQAGKKLTPEAAEKAANIWLSGKPLAAARKELRKEVPDALKAMKDEGLKEALGGVRLRVPLSRRLTGKEVSQTIIPGRLTEQLTAPLGQGMRKLVDPVRDRVLPHGLSTMERAGRQGWDMARAIREGANRAHQVNRLGAKAGRDALRVTGVAQRVGGRKSLRETEKRFIDAAEGRLDPATLSKAEREAFAGFDAFRNESLDLLRKSGMEIGKVKNYFPHAPSRALRDLMDPADADALILTGRESARAKTRKGPHSWHEANEALKAKHKLPDDVDALIRNPAEAIAEYTSAVSRHVQGASVRSTQLPSGLLALGGKKARDRVVEGGPLAGVREAELVGAGYKTGKKGIQQAIDDANKTALGASLGTPTAPARFSRLTPEVQQGLAELATRKRAAPAFGRFLQGVAPNQVRMTSAKLRTQGVEGEIRKAALRRAGARQGDAQRFIQEALEGKVWPVARYAKGEAPEGFAKLSPNLLLPQLRGLHAPVPVAKELNEFFRAADPNRFMRGVQTFHKAFRFAVTIPWPGFHVRNHLGNWFNNMLGEVHPEHYYRFWRIMSGALDDKPIRGTGMTGRQVREELVSQNVLDGSASSMLRDMSQRSGGRLDRMHHAIGETFLGIPVSRIPGARQLAGRRLMESTEKMHRGPAFLAALERTQDPYAARLFTIARQGDYSELGSSERFIREVVPFYKFTRYNVPLQVESLIQQPGRARLPEKFFRSLEGPDREEFENQGGMFTWWQAANQAFMSPFQEGAVMQMDIPQRDLNQWLPSSFSPDELLRPGRAALSSTSPLLQQPFQQILKQRIFDGSTVKDWDTPGGVMGTVGKLLAPLDKTGQFVRVTPGGEIQMHSLLREWINATPASRLSSSMQQVLDPRDDRPFPERLYPLFLGARHQEITDRQQAGVRYGRKKELDDLQSQLFDLGYEADEIFEPRPRAPVSTSSSLTDFDRKWGL